MEAESTSQSVNVEKRVKALKKKLREIDEIASKDPAELTADQREKLNRRATLEEELSALSISS